MLNLVIGSRAVAVIGAELLGNLAGVSAKGLQAVELNECNQCM